MTHDLRRLLAHITFGRESVGKPSGRAIYSGVDNYIDVCYITWSVALYLR